VTTTVELPVLDLQTEADLWVPECEVWLIVEDHRCGAVVRFLVHIFCPECQEWRWARMCAGTVALSDPATVAPQILRPGGTQPRGRSLCADFGNLMTPLPTRRWVANRKICCADATRRLNATVPSRLSCAAWSRE